MAPSLYCTSLLGRSVGIRTGSMALLQSVGFRRRAASVVLANPLVAVLWASPVKPVLPGPTACGRIYLAAVMRNSCNDDIKMTWSHWIKTIWSHWLAPSHQQDIAPC
jgi:hypothetical protein